MLYIIVWYVYVYICAYVCSTSSCCVHDVCLELYLRILGNFLVICTKFQNLSRSKNFKKKIRDATHCYINFKI